MDQRVTKRSSSYFLTIEQWKTKIEEALKAPGAAGPIRNINDDDRREFDAIFRQSCAVPSVENCRIFRHRGAPLP
jgi:hypothetical protein